jgi:polyketide synthase PksN
MGELGLPLQVSDQAEAFALPPSLLDGALQASIGLALSQPQDKLSLPFAVEAVEVFGPVPAKAVALVRQSAGNSAGGAILKLDVSLVDPQGQVCVRLQGFSSRVLEGTPGQVQVQAQAQTLLLRPVWQGGRRHSGSPVERQTGWPVVRS